jgi:hypothetical protein
MHNVYVNQLAVVRRDAANVSIDADPTNPAWQLPVRANQIDRVELLELMQNVPAGRAPATGAKAPFAACIMLRRPACVRTCTYSRNRSQKVSGRC